jgi:hypothetical protein
MPFLEAPPMPPKKLKGMDTTNAQGQDTTRNTRALFIHSAKVAPGTTRGGITAREAAANTTKGV